jgi:hypothetical protein
MFHFTKKRAIVMAVVGSLALSVGAYAYFSANGSGSGSATTGSSSPVTISSTSPTTLYPTKSSLVTITVANPGGGPQKVGTVHLDGITADVAHAACVVSSSGANAAFTMDDLTLNRIIAAGASTSENVWLTMNDTGADQNNCQGATLTLAYSSN